MRSFWVDAFEKKNVSASFKYIDPTYIQHEADMPTATQWTDYWSGVFAMPAKGPGRFTTDAQHDRKTQIVSLIGDDVLALVEAHDTGTWDIDKDKGKHLDIQYYDLFRCAGGKLVEHWFMPYRPGRTAGSAPISSPNSQP